MRRLGLSLGGVTAGVAVLVLVDAVFHVVPVDPRPALWWPPWILLAILLFLDVPAIRRLARLVAVETTKLLRARILQASLVATTVVTVFVALTWQAPEEGIPGWTLAANVLGAGLWAAEVFVLVLGATAIAGEATGGTLKMMLPHAYTRADWVRAKAATLVLAALVLTLLAAGVAVGAGLWRFGLGDVLLPALFGGEPEVFLTSDELTWMLVETIVAGFAALVATGLLGLLLSVCFDGVVAALCFAFLLFFGLRLADIVLGLPYETMALLYTWHPAEMRTALAQLGRAFSETPWRAASLPTALSLSLITGTAALLLAIVIFRRRDLTSA